MTSKNSLPPINGSVLESSSVENNAGSADDSHPNLTHANHNSASTSVARLSQPPASLANGLANGSADGNHHSNVSNASSASNSNSMSQTPEEVLTGFIVAVHRKMVRMQGLCLYVLAQTANTFFAKILDAHFLQYL